MAFKEPNDTLVSEQSIFSENQDYKSFLRVAVNPYIPIFQGLCTRGGRKLITHTQTHTHTHGATTVNLAHMCTKD